MHLVLKIVALLFEMVGIFYLAREVRRGHRMEETVKNHEWAKLMNYLYAAQDYRGLYLLNRLDQGDTPEQAREWIQALDAPSIKTAVEKLWGAHAAEFSRVLTEWGEKTSPRERRKRRRDLVTGTVSVLAGAVLGFLLGLRPEPTVIVTEEHRTTEGSVGWHQLPASPPFPSGSASFDEEVAGCPGKASLAGQVEGWRARVVTEWKGRQRPSAVDSIVLIGSTDRMRLSPRLRRQYESNAGLARARAEAVKELLVTATANEIPDHKITRERVMIQISGPVHTPQEWKKLSIAEACSDPAFGADRSVQLWIPARHFAVPPENRAVTSTGTSDLSGTPLLETQTAQAGGS